MILRKKLIMICCCLAVLMLTACTLYAAETTAEKKIAKLTIKTTLSDDKKKLTVEGYLTDNKTGEPLSNQILFLIYTAQGCDDDVRTYQRVITDQNGHYHGEIYYWATELNPTYLDYSYGRSYTPPINTEHGNYGSIYIKLSTKDLLVTEGVFYSK